MIKFKFGHLLRTLKHMFWDLPDKNKLEQSLFKEQIKIYYNFTSSAFYGFLAVFIAFFLDQNYLLSLVIGIPTSLLFIRLLFLFGRNLASD